MSFKAASNLLKPAIIPFADVDIQGNAMVCKWIAPAAGFVTFTTSFSTTDVAVAAAGIKCQLATPNAANAANSDVCAATAGQL